MCVVCFCAHGVFNCCLLDPTSTITSPVTFCAPLPQNLADLAHGLQLLRFARRLVPVRRSDAALGILRSILVRRFLRALAHPRLFLIPCRFADRSARRARILRFFWLAALLSDLSCWPVLLDSARSANAARPCYGFILFIMFAIASFSLSINDVLSFDAFCFESCLPLLLIARFRCPSILILIGVVAVRLLSPLSRSSPCRLVRSFCWRLSGRFLGLSPPADCSHPADPVLHLRIRRLVVLRSRLRPDSLIHRRCLQSHRPSSHSVASAASAGRTCRTRSSPATVPSSFPGHRVAHPNNPHATTASASAGYRNRDRPTEPPPAHPQFAQLNPLPAAASPGSPDLRPRLAMRNTSPSIARRPGSAGGRSFAPAYSGRNACAKAIQPRPKLATVNSATQYQFRISVPASSSRIAPPMPIASASADWSRR